MLLNTSLSYIPSRHHVLSSPFGFPCVISSAWDVLFTPTSPRCQISHVRVKAQLKRHVLIREITNIFCLLYHLLHPALY